MSSYFQGDLLEILYMIGENLYNTDSNEVKIDLRRKQFGRSFIPLDSEIQDSELEELHQFRSFQLSLDNIRPQPEGDRVCRTIRVPSSAKNIKGFLPSFTGYNGENGLIHRITLFECEAEVKSRKTGECAEDDLKSCSRLLFVWTRGSRGELFPQQSALKLNSRHVLLEVIYNSGTGWLYDSSGLELFYSEDDPDYQVI